MPNLFLKGPIFRTSLTSSYLKCTAIALRNLTSLKITSKTSQELPLKGFIMLIEMILGIFWFYKLIFIYYILKFAEILTSGLRLFGYSSSSFENVATGRIPQIFSRRRRRSLEQKLFHLLQKVQL